MGWFYNPPPQPPSLAPEPPGATAVGNAPPTPIGAGAITAALRSTWPVEQWPAQSSPIIAAQLAVPILSPFTVPYPLPFWNGPLWNALRSTWPQEVWGSKTLIGGGVGALTASVLIPTQAGPSIEADLLVTIRSTWPAESWPAQTGAQVASLLAGVVNPPVFFPVPPLGLRMGIFGTWGPESWSAQSEAGVASGLAQQQQPPIYIPSSRVPKLAQLVSMWPREDWSAQSAPPRAAWIPLPVTAIPFPVPHNEARLWPQEGWAAQSARTLAAGFAQTVAAAPFIPVSARMTLTLGWPQENWAAQSSVLGAGLQSLFAPLPTAEEPDPVTAPVYGWPQENWSAQSRPAIAAQFATVQLPPPPYSVQTLAPIKLWPREDWPAQFVAQAGHAAPAPNPPKPPGFRVQAMTAGWYQGLYYVPGDVFDLVTALDFSDATINYELRAGEYGAGWMLKVVLTTPLYQAETAQPSPVFPAVDPKRRFVL